MLEPSSSLVIPRWRRRGLVLAVAVLLLGLPASSMAGTFSSGTFGLSIGALPTVTLGSHPVPFSISAGGSMVEPAGVFGPAIVPLPRALFTGVPQLSGLTLVNVANGTKVVSAAGSPGGGLGGVGGLVGTAVVNVLGLINLSIPLSVVGATTGTSPCCVSGGIYITLFGRPWGTGPQVVTGITTTTPGMAVLHTVTLTGSQMGTLSGNATVTLVSAFKVVSNVTGNLPGFAVQTLRFVPEPGGLLLLATGIAGLVIVGRRKMRESGRGP